LKKVSEVAIIFPNQLFKINPILKPNRQVYLIEEFLFFSQYKFHKQKLLLHRISMKSYEKFLIEEKYKVKYIESIEKNHDIRIFLKEIKEEYSDFYFILPVDNYLELRINKELQGKNIFFHENFILRYATKLNKKIKFICNNSYSINSILEAISVILIKVFPKKKKGPVKALFHFLTCKR
jgi:deoxyribodipyrimidine photolyase-like uncharacterized protein